MKKIKHYEKKYMVNISEFLKKSGIIILVSVASSSIVTTTVIAYNKENTYKYPIITSQQIETDNNINIFDKNTTDKNITKNIEKKDELIENDYELDNKLLNDPIFKLNTEFKKEDFRNYMFGLLDKETKERIDKLIEEEIALTNYKIANVPEHVVHDSVKSTILFLLSGENLSAFNYIDSFREKINYNVAALISLFKLETGSNKINYSTTVRSHTLAFGRGQINGSTLGEISVRLLESGYPLDKIKHSYNSKKFKYPYHKIKALVQKLSKNNNWSSKYKDKTINDLISISKRFNYRVKTYIKDKYKNNIPKKFNFLLNEYNNFSNIKLFDWSIAMLELYKDPVFQGYMSLHVLQEKMRIASRIYKNKIFNSNDLLFYSFELYNGSQKIVKDSLLGKVKYSKIYANKVNNYFKNFINDIKDNQLYTLNNIQHLDSEIDI